MAVPSFVFTQNLVAPIYANTAATVEIDHDDAEHTELDLTFVWRKNGIQTLKTITYSLVPIASNQSDSLELDTVDISKGDTIQVTVTANDRNGGSFTDSSATIVLSNSAPDLPTMLRQLQDDGENDIPDGGSVPQQTVILSAYAKDSVDGDDVQLEFEVKDTATAFDGLGTVSSAVGRYGTHTVSYSSLTADTYKWRVRTKDDSGDASDWVEFPIAGTDFELTTAPFGYAWADPATNVSIELTPNDDGDVVLDWTDASHDSVLPSAITYTVEYSDNCGISWNLIETTAAGVTTSFFDVDSYGLGQYQFRVTANDGSNDGVPIVNPFSVTLYARDKCRFRWIDPVSGATVETQEFDWLEPEYDGFWAKPRLARIEGNISGVNVVRKADATRQVLTAAGILLDDPVVDRIQEIVQGRDESQEWQQLDVEFMDTFGNFWMVKIDEFNPIFERGLEELGWNTILRVIKPPLEYKTPCES